MPPLSFDSLRMGRKRYSAKQKSDYSFKIPCCLLLLFPFKSTSLNAKMDFTIDQEKRKAVQELLWLFLLSFFLWLALNKNSGFSLRLPCIPSAGDPFLSSSFWISSLPTELISFSPLSSLFLSLTFLLCALPTQTLCPFPFFTSFSLVIGSILPFSVSVCFHSQQRWKKRGDRNTNTASEARSVFYESLILSFWCAIVLLK